MPELILLVFAYFLGSVPFGLLLARWRKGLDVREGGSGNIGATNVLRQAGPLLGVATLACDAAKGALPALLALWAGSDALAGAAALCAFLGHCFPVYSRFKGGGKGVATAAGCALALCWQALAGALVVFVLAVRVSGRVSVGSLLASASLPLFALAFFESFWIVSAFFLMSLLVWYRHKENISRLRQGTEPRMFGKSKNP